MAEMMNPVQNNNDEIDLVHVLERISRFLSFYKKEFIIMAIIGMLCGYAIHLTQPKLYGATLILESQLLTNSEEIAIIESWGNLLNHHEYGVLSGNLNCPESVLRKLKQISATNVQGFQPTSSFIIETLVNDTAILEDLQKGIIYGLENNEFVKAKVDLKRNNTVKIIENINQEIDRLDSTKKKIESGLLGNTRSPSSLIFNISDVNVQMIDLKEKLYKYQDELKFVNAIQVLQKFEKYVKPPGERLLTMLISGFLGGLFIGFVLAIVKNLRMKIAILRKTMQYPLPIKEVV
jgi:hypothetical protein